ncbi:MAG: phage integrase N-terminal SAM-like domain-containing protein [Verrucomicrobia bacterium]|nr:phage integrase N-terminal SAM-like domain-containing protein [Verrucomicrobiota bacterium]
MPPAGRGCRAPPHPGSPGAGPNPSFQAFVRSRPTAELAGQGVRGFLSDLAVRQRVAASTQNQAFNALLFFYRVQVLVLTIDTRARPPELAKGFGEARSGPRNS